VESRALGDGSRHFASRSTSPVPHGTFSALYTVATFPQRVVCTSPLHSSFLKLYSLNSCISKSDFGHSQRSSLLSLSCWVCCGSDELVNMATWGLSSRSGSAFISIDPVTILNKRSEQKLRELRYFDNSPFILAPLAKPHTQLRVAFHGVRDRKSDILRNMHE